MCKLVYCRELWLAAACPLLAGALFSLDMIVMLIFLNAFRLSLIRAPETNKYDAAACRACGANDATAPDCSFVNDYPSILHIAAGLVRVHSTMHNCLGHGERNDLERGEE